MNKAIRDLTTAERIAAAYQCARGRLAEIGDSPDYATAFRNLEIACGALMFIRDTLEPIAPSDAICTDCVSHLADAELKDGTCPHCCGTVIRRKELPAMQVRFEPHSSTHSRIYDSDTNDTLEIVPLPELHPKLTTWREHARAVNAERRRFLATPHAPRETVGYRHYPRRRQV